jgi:hypothetical protein
MPAMTFGAVGLAEGTVVPPAEETHHLMPMMTTRVHRSTRRRMRLPPLMPPWRPWPPEVPEELPEPQAIGAYGLPSDAFQTTRRPPAPGEPALVARPQADSIRVVLI